MSTDPVATKRPDPLLLPPHEYPLPYGLCMTPVQEVSDDGSMHAASHADFPKITPPASMILVATVASYVGTQDASRGSMPFKQRMPANAMLSLIATRLPARREDVGLELLAMHLVAYALPSLSSAVFGMEIPVRV